MRHVLFAFAVLCFLAPRAAPAAEEPFVADGEIVYRGSAAYDAGHVRGPKVNMSLTKDGRWGGNLLDQDVMLTVTDKKITGAGVNLVVTRDATSIAVEGLVSGVRVRVKATQDTFVGRVGNRQLECKRSPDGVWFLADGPRVAAIKFKGSAGRMPDVPMPQWLFAVIGSI